MLTVKGSYATIMDKLGCCAHLVLLPANGANRRDYTVTEAIELDIKEIFGVLLKRVWIISLCAVLTGAAVFVYIAKFVTPLYRAEVTMYVNNNSGNTEFVSSSNLAVALQLVNTYVNIIQSNKVLEKVVDTADLTLTPAQIRGMISANAVNETEMFAVRVTSPDPELSAKIANAIADVAPQEITQIIEGSSAKVIDYANVPQRPVSPGYTMKTLLGFVVGALLSTAFFVIHYLLDTHVKTEEELEKICNIPVLGVIPDFAQPVKEVRKKGRQRK